MGRPTDSGERLLGNGNRWAHVVREDETFRDVPLADDRDALGESIDGVLFCDGCGEQFRETDDEHSEGSADPYFGTWCNECGDERFPPEPEEA